MITPKPSSGGWALFGAVWCLAVGVVGLAAPVVVWISTW